MALCGQDLLIAPQAGGDMACGDAGCTGNRLRAEGLFTAELMGEAKREG